jgi:hypothetical protein
MLNTNTGDPNWTTIVYKVGNKISEVKKSKKYIYYFMRSRNTKAFHKLCNNIDGKRFLDRTKIAPITKPRNTRGSIL